MQDANSGLQTLIKTEAMDNIPDSGISSSSPIPTNPNNTSSSSNSSLPENFGSLNSQFCGLNSRLHASSSPNLNLAPLQMPPPPPMPSFNYNNASLFNQHFRSGGLGQIAFPPTHHNIFGLFKNGQVC